MFCVLPRQSKNVAISAAQAQWVKSPSKSPKLIIFFGAAFEIVNYMDYLNVSGGGNCKAIVRNFRRSGSEFIILQMHMMTENGTFCGQKLHP
jgi:hypothetical protein